MLSPDDLSQLEASPGRLIVAYSGGCDSHVLLHYLQQHLEHDVEALHINHGLSEHADDWQHHCETVCDALNVPLSSFAVEVTQSGSLEANARAARYQVFEMVLQAGDVLLMGHHQDDQMETIFLNMLSGRALLGVQGMPARRSLGRGVLLRPLLDCACSTLRDYAQRQGLSWIEDESNRDTRHDRNYLRAEVIPVLTARWPKLADTMSEHWRKNAETIEHLEQEARRDFEKLKMSADCISFAGFAELPEQRAVALLRVWFHLMGSERNPGSSTLKTAFEVLTSEVTESPTFAAAGFQLQRFRSRLILLPDRHGSRAVHPEDGQLLEQRGRFGAGILSADIVKGRGVSVPYRQLAFRLRSGGEKLLVNGHHRTLKNLFQKSGCPPLVRNQLPLIYEGDQLIGIAGIDQWDIPMVTADGYQPGPDAEGYHINWSPESDNRYSD